MHRRYGAFDMETSPVRRLCYQVAMSLDGFIADPDHGADWIPMDPDIDFATIFDRFDTLVMGRRTFDGMVAAGREETPGKDTVVFSRTLDPASHPSVRVTAEEPGDVIRELKAREGKDLWLFGGGHLFRSLLQADVVDTVEVAVLPVLLGGGVSLLRSPGPRRKLRLTGHRLYEESGIMLLEYAVEPASNRS